MDREFLKAAANEVKAKLPDNYGFILLAFPFNGEGDARLVYISNAQRTDALNAMKEAQSNQCTSPNSLPKPRPQSLTR